MWKRRNLECSVCGAQLPAGEKDTPGRVCCRLLADLYGQKFYCDGRLIPKAGPWYRAELVDGEGREA